MTTKNLAVALIKFHDSEAAAKKGAANPFFKSKYTSLRKSLRLSHEAGKVGLTFTQLVDFDEHHIFVTTILMHESGECVTGRTPVLTKDNTDPQKMGSSITYAKRYGLQAAFGLPSEDDDGNAASVSTPVTKSPEEHKPTEEAW